MKEMLGTLANDREFKKEDSGLEATDTPMYDFAIFNEGAFESAHESDSQFVDSDDVCMMRDIIEIE
jgi:hypothetical protein